MGIEKKSFYSVKGCNLKTNVKDVDESSRTVTGIYNSYNFLDSDGDVLLPGCAKVSIKQRGPASKAVAKIKHALNHDLTQLPGKLMLLEERMVDGVMGIYFETRMTDTQLGNDTLKNYLAGIYDNHSIGFQYMQMEWIERDAKGWDKIINQLINPEEAEGKNYVFAIKEINLFEGSTVAFGANSLTPFLGMAKSANKEAIKFALFERMNKLESTLKGGSQSDDMMHLFELQVLQIKQLMEEMCERMVVGGDGKKEEMIVQVEKEKEEEIKEEKQLYSQGLVDKFSLE